MKTNLVKVLLTVVCLFAFSLGKSMAAVKVTLTVDEQTKRPAHLDDAARHLGDLLTEINRAQAGKDKLSTKRLQMDDFSVKSLERLWAVTPFKCDDEEIVERCWVFKDGSMMVRNIPLVIVPQGEDFGMGTYQEAVIEFDAMGIITDFRLAIDSQTGESFSHCGDDVVSEERKMIIMQYLERFRTAYNQRDIQYIEQVFSDDALIITGKVIYTRKAGDFNVKNRNIQYTRQNKQQYIRNLKKAFLRNKWINVKFSQIGQNDCAFITRSKKNPNMYGVRLLQEWKSSSYSDEGYLFLLWEFPTDGGYPSIHVRTWQPSKVGKSQIQPDDEISTLGSFGL